MCLYRFPGAAAAIAQDKPADTPPDLPEQAAAREPEAREPANTGLS
ncbi:hypothetical protein GCM10010492_52860 [Saccharothrix mutabilis subsp. mutabilis]|uniref:Uncharacterized protein n=1 Tax=Saccharothrix mutabilis subsp. mutabilis TaxID=66855 RepID=A0ABP3E1T1_9PSEU